MDEEDNKDDKLEAGLHPPRNSEMPGGISRIPQASELQERQIAQLDELRQMQLKLPNPALMVDRSSRHGLKPKNSQYDSNVQRTPSIDTIQQLGLQDLNNQRSKIKDERRLSQDKSQQLQSANDKVDQMINNWRKIKDNAPQPQERPQYPQTFQSIQEKPEIDGNSSQNIYDEEEENLLTNDNDQDLFNQSVHPYPPFYVQTQTTPQSDKFQQLYSATPKPYAQKREVIGIEGDKYCSQKMALQSDNSDCNLMRPSTAQTQKNKITKAQNSNKMKTQTNETHQPSNKKQQLIITANNSKLTESIKSSKKESQQGKTQNTQINERGRQSQQQQQQQQPATLTAKNVNQQPKKVVQVKQPALPGVKKTDPGNYLINLNQKEQNEVKLIMTNLKKQKQQLIQIYEKKEKNNINKGDSKEQIVANIDLLLELLSVDFEIPL